jgi:hypothetical protein
VGGDALRKDPHSGLKGNCGTKAGVEAKVTSALGTGRTSRAVVVMAEGNHCHRGSLWN